VEKLLRRVAGFYLMVRHRILGRRHGRLVLEWLDGVPLVVLPSVFNPVLLRTGAVLARAVANEYHAAGGIGRTALDMGTGSGVGALFAASRGFRVVAVDINHEAVRCARLNALLNGFQERIEVRDGDLWHPVGAERFDLVLFNPPFFRGHPRSAQDHAWRSPDVIERFAAGLPDHLTPDGRALVVLSTDGEGGAMLEALAGAALAVEPALRKDLGSEVATVYSVMHRSGRSTEVGIAHGSRSRM
jgi:methylase of polypeptide subunit release factors